MSYGENQTTVALCKVDFDNSYKFVRDFENTGVRDMYFQGQSSYRTLTGDFRFIDGEGTDALHKDIKIAMPPKDAQEYNYLIYDNNDGKNKHYCFITGVDFINYETALLHLEIDVFQEWQFTFAFTQCLIKRNTVRNDNDYADLRTPDFMPCDADFIVDCSPILRDLDTRPYLVCTEFKTSDDRLFNQSITIIENVTLPFYIICFGTIQELADYILNFPYHDISLDTIVSVGRVSKAVISEKCILTNNHTGSVTLAGSGSFNFRTFNALSKQRTLMLERADDIAETYIPYNNKLLTYPYNFARIETVGNHLDLQWEDSYFDDRDQIACTLHYTFTDCFKCYLMPYGYNQNTQIAETYYSYENAIEIPIAFTVPFSKDTFYQFMNSNAVRIENERTANNVGYILGGLEILGGLGLTALTEGAGSAIGLGMITGGASQIFSSYKADSELTDEIEQQKKSRSAKMQGTVTPESLTLGNNIWARWEWLSVSPDYAYTIDKYFAVYGYKLNRIRLPRLKNRQKWDYLQTEGCTVYNVTPNDHKLKLQSIFNNGVTIWHETTGRIGDYSSLYNPTV